MCCRLVSSSAIVYLQFSGITEEMLSGVIATRADVQARCLELFGQDTVLVGHSLVSDLKALKVLDLCIGMSVAPTTMCTRICHFNIK